jgi:hypothetical protein
MEKEYKYKEQSPIHHLPKGRGLLGHEVKHDEIIDDIVERLEQSHPNGKSLDHLRFNWNGVDGEADIAYSDKTGKNIYLIEVKTNDHKSARVKATQQLYKDFVFFNNTGDYERFFLFYAYNSKQNKHRPYYVELMGIEHKE